MSSPEPREIASPLTFDKDFRGVVDRDFGIRVLSADDVLEPEDVAAPKAQVPSSSATEPVTSENSEESVEDLIPSPEDHTVPVEPGPSQLPSEEESLQDSTKQTNPGVSVPPVLTSQIQTSSSPSEVK